MCKKVIIYYKTIEFKWYLTLEDVLETLRLQWQS